MMAINRYRLKTLISKNNVQAKRVEKLLNNIDYLIGAILLGNNFVNILAASIATLLSIKLYGEGSVIIASIFLSMVLIKVLVQFQLQSHSLDSKLLLLQCM